jgi:hypothetical protein
MKKASEALKAVKHKKSATEKPNPKHKQDFEGLLDLAIKLPKKKG